jgi:hypothetical protein
MFHRFVGSEDRGCGRKEYHRPYITGHYETVRYGRVQKFCAGNNAGGALWGTVWFSPGGAEAASVLVWTDRRDGLYEYELVVSVRVAYRSWKSTKVGAARARCMEELPAAGPHEHWEFVGTTPTNPRVRIAPRPYYAVA